MAIIEVSTISEEPPLWLRNFTNSDGFYLFPAEYLWRFGADGTDFVLGLDGPAQFLLSVFLKTLKKY
jgi:hypothetical protein